MQLGKKSEEQHRQCRERQQLFERKTELGLGANLDFLGNCPSSHQCSTLYLCCCQEKWTDHRLNLLRWENFKVEKISLGMIETSFDNGVKGTIPTAIVLRSKAIKMLLDDAELPPDPCVQEKWTTQHLNLLGWEKFKAEKIPLGLIKTSFEYVHANEVSWYIYQQQKMQATLTHHFSQHAVSYFVN